MAEITKNDAVVAASPAADAKEVPQDNHGEDEDESSDVEMEGASYSNS